MVECAQAAAAPRPPSPSSPIPTVTVGPGVAPGPPSCGSRGVADSHRRWGIAPRPEDELLLVLRQRVYGGAMRGRRLAGAPVDGVGRAGLRLRELLHLGGHR